MLACETTMQELGDVDDEERQRQRQKQNHELEASISQVQVQTRAGADTGRCRQGGSLVACLSSSCVDRVRGSKLSLDQSSDSIRYSALIHFELVDRVEQLLDLR